MYERKYVTLDKLPLIVSEIYSKTKAEKFCTLDIETTGLDCTHDKIISISITFNSTTFLFYFNTDKDHLGGRPNPSAILPYSSIRLILQPLLYFRTYIHNAKFDIGFFNVSIGHECTMLLAKIINNQRLSYSLDNLGKEYLGKEKDNRIKEYMNKNKLYDLIDTGKKQKKKDYKFHLVPALMLLEYNAADTELLYDLVIELEKEYDYLNGFDKKFPTLEKVRKLEQNTLDVLTRMENRGITLDLQYIKEALDHEVDIYQECMAKFEAITGKEFVDSGKALKPIFESFNIPYGLTEKGNPSFKTEAIENFDHEIIDLILQYRSSYKKANTYYRELYDKGKVANGIYYFDYRQYGTATGRMSSNLIQLIPKRQPEKDKYKVRRCFVAREEFDLFMIDFDQMEYRLLLDLAGEDEVIEKVLGGLDVHTATAELMGVERHQAKTLNFMLLYGGGAKKLADTLGISLNEAYKIKAKYFEALPKVKEFTKGIIKTAENRGFIFSWYGRRFQFKKYFAYKAPNHFIQGGCADIVKNAMVLIDSFLSDKRSKMLLQIHDEIIFEIHKDERHIIEELKSLMQFSYPHKKLPLTVGVEYGKNWYDKKEYK